VKYLKLYESFDNSSVSESDTIDGLLKQIDDIFTQHVNESVELRYTEDKYHKPSDIIDFDNIELKKLTDYLEKKLHILHRSSKLVGCDSYTVNDTHTNRWIFIQKKDKHSGLYNSWYVMALNDEYFQVSSSMLSYKCDQIEGVIDLLGVLLSS
jgi:hypothetical protein